ncbi:metallophosphoesterase family protein [Corynebacterium endometrii]|uniref:Nuclease SbcCD subunit D n=1 Tax=Corynebacterium endometrii TaxID=2488819 RepID=A0A4P7QFN8_9CORY|nr:DNA repair exonuclease [Corynebacterium endometrii]QCB28220.1 putative metallophosphoesterase YhaO [Corynebacterium endometrii]
MITFIHTSDLQLGMTRWFLDDDAQARFSAARLSSITKLGELAVDSGASFIVVAGDVFEHNALEDRTRLRAFEAFSRLPVPVYLLPGNHDPLVADSIFFSSSAENVHVLDSSQPIEAADGVEIVGAPYKSKRANYDLVAAAIEPLETTDSIRIVVGHGQVNSRESDKAPDIIDLDTVENALRRGAIDYVALGDTHSTESWGSTGAVWFSGAPETTAYKEVGSGGGESDSGNALVVTIDKPSAQQGATVAVDKREIGEWHFEALEHAVDSQADAEEFIELLKAYPSKSTTAIKYGLRGTVSLSVQAYLQKELSELEPVFASLRPRKRTMDLHLEPEEKELEELDITGYARGALDELLGELDRSTVARDAANLLYRLSRKGVKN